MTTRLEYLKNVENVIRDKYRCDAAHRKTVFVHERTASNANVWFGDVEVFDLDGCGESKRCYAWQCVECGRQILTVLHSNLVDSPHRAVQSAVFMGIQHNQDRRRRRPKNPPAANRWGQKGVI